MSAKFGVTKKLAAPNLRLLPCPLKRSAVFRPSVPGTSEVLSSNVLRAVLTLAGIPGRAMAEPMQSAGLAMFSASMKSSADASDRIWRSLPKPFLPIAARVPFKSRSRRITSPRTAMISGELKRLWQAAS